MSCIADLSPEVGQEILAGPTLYRLPAAAPACAAPPCLGALQVVWSGVAVNTGINALASNQGLCAVADVWGSNTLAPPGPANPPDGEPEAIFIADGNLMILNGRTGQLIEQQSLGGGPRGGAPNVDDFDGDGFLEIASALSDFYIVVDLQPATDGAGACPAWPTNLSRAFLDGQSDNPNVLVNGLTRDPGGVGAATLPSGAVDPGTCSGDADCNPGAVCNAQARSCVCLHNGWKRESDDNSSRATSSSVFDFNGDGAAEVLYNDECEFRVYDGGDGQRALRGHLSQPHLDREPGRRRRGQRRQRRGGDRAQHGARNRSCDDDPPGTILGPNGIRVWGDSQDTWVSARRIWNQQSYHVTNITESGAVPAHAPESWRAFNGSRFNTYRSQPRTFGVAPDLRVTAIGVFSPDAGCGTLSNVIDITFEVINSGDLRVGPGVVVRFFGDWDGVRTPLTDASGAALLAVLPDGVDPGRSVIATTSFDLASQAGQTRLPDSITVFVDGGGGADSTFGAERECDETNNDRTVPVEPKAQLPDLSLNVGAVTPSCAIGQVTVNVTAVNAGAVTANGAVIQLFAGNPAQGGTLLAEQRLDAPLGPLSSLNLDISVAGFPRNREITIWGAIDPDGVIAECNEGDNTDPADAAVRCEDLR